jgi:predicted DNA-binding protein
MLPIEESERLRHHAERIGWEKSALARAGIFDKLNALDEQEAFYLAHKAARKKGGIAKVGSLPGGVEAVGMTFKRASKPDEKEETTVETPIPANKAAATLAKLKDSFKRYAEYIEAAEGDVDRSIRIQTVLDGMMERAPREIAQAAFVELQEFLKVRDLMKPKVIVKVPEGVPISGDVDED